LQLHYVDVCYGRGVYFSTSFHYSASVIYSPPDLAHNKYVFQCRVLTGRYDVGHRDLVEPPVRDHATHSLYDSAVNHVDNPSIFVVFHDAQAYPEYLVTFRCCVTE